MPMTLKVVSIEGSTLYCRNLHPEARRTLRFPTTIANAMLKQLNGAIIYLDNQTLYLDKDFEYPFAICITKDQYNSVADIKSALALAELKKSIGVDVQNYKKSGKGRIDFYKSYEGKPIEVWIDDLDSVQHYMNIPADIEPQIISVLFKSFYFQVEPGTPNSKGETCPYLRPIDPRFIKLAPDVKQLRIGCVDFIGCPMEEEGYYGRYIRTMKRKRIITMDD